MKKIIFEDTTVVKQPYVEINGVEHEVHDGEYQGGTDLNAETFNTMQNNIAGYIDGEESMGNIIVEDIQNKNLFNINDITYQANINVTISNNTITIAYGGGMTSLVDFNSIDNTNNKYILSYNCSYNKSRYLLIPYNSSNQVITNLSLTGFTYNSSYNAYYKDFENNTDISDTFELPNTVSYFRIGLINMDSTNQNNVTYSNIQVEKGETTTDYIEYKEYGYKKGSNSNGSWIKYDDGTLICYKKISVSATFSSSQKWGSMWESNALDLGDYPYSFIEIPILNITNASTSGGFYECIENKTNTKIGKVYMCRPDDINATISYTFDIIAIGKWK